MKSEQYQKLLLDVWREACRHIEMGESAETFLRMLRQQVALDGIIIHWLDQEHRRVSVAAVVPGQLRSSIVAPIEEVSEKQFRQLAEWIRAGVILRHESADRKLLPVPLLNALAEGTSGILVAPLCGPHGTLGMCSLLPAKGHPLTGQHRDLLLAIQEPLAVALENDRRLHELAVLREAAEADRRTLLTRLGREEMGGLVVGMESGLSLVIARVRLCSRSLVPVLILGETGTGKEVIAREIHNGSGRGSGPFIRVNCGAIPRELIDSQLFGHEKGSFTGAVEARQGWFERADGGTLFLDEIGELPPDAQVRFLRVLQDGFVERVGSQRVTPVDVRVVAATHRNLAEMVSNGRFREDLWYRIAVFPILIPPLRERLHDVPALVDHFVRRAAVRFGLAAVQATEADIRLMQTYDWPGNIRELGAVIDRAVILGEGSTLEIEAAMGTPHSAAAGRVGLPSASAVFQSPARISSAPVSQAAAASPRVETLEQAMRRQIEAALEATRGRIEGAHGAAAVLEINPHTLRARMRKLGIKWASFRAPRMDR